MKRPRNLLVILLAVAALLVAQRAPGLSAASTAHAARPAAGVATAGKTVSYDQYSLMVDGRRVFLQAGEFEYWRLPSPGLWLDILEKMKAAGFNAVSVYFNWAYHSPKPGVYDFTGVRNVDEFLRMAEQTGLYVIARPGPYINAETTGGGFPGWLKEVPGRARSSAPGYTQAYTDWLGHIDPVIARHQVTRGGSVILYQAENEYAVNTDAQYMTGIQNKARADGIDVPVISNDCCDAASWTSSWASGPGAVQLPGVDTYPQSFDCANPTTTWGPWGAGITERLRPDTPNITPEYQAGAVTSWGGAGSQGCRELTGPDYMKFFYKSNLILGGVTSFSYYMAYGGTSWGWLPGPGNFTSYDYGAAITEDRQLTSKYDEFKRQGYFLRATMPVVAKTHPATAPASSNSAIQTAARVNPDTGTQFVLIRHAVSTSATSESATLDWTTPDGRYSVPVQLSGRDAKVFLAGYDLGGQRLVYSTSEVMTSVFSGDRDVALLYGRQGAPGETVLRYSSRPTVTVLGGTVQASYDAATGDEKLSYAHDGLDRVLISGGGRRPMLLLIGTDATAATFWQAGTVAGPVLVRGTHLVRSARVTGDAVALTADIAGAGDVEVFGPASLRHLAIDGQRVDVRPTASGSLLGHLTSDEPARRPALTARPALPALTDWRTRTEAPEAQPGFNDAGWVSADHTTTALPYPPKTLPVLYADDYGFNYGNVWYRGHFTATGSQTAISLNAITGGSGIYLVWLDGQYLGSADGGTQADSDTHNLNPGPGNFPIPAGLLKPGEKSVLSVLVENMSNNDDWIADDNRFKQPRGLYAASIAGSSGTITWKIQGALGGGNLNDPVRGPLNTGGLYGERSGWSLPGYPDASWSPAGDIARASVASGSVTWYRGTFSLHLPEGQDTPIDLRFAGSTGRYRVSVFLNGWNLGQYINNLGPQHDFVLPAGLLRSRGDNTLALAVIAQDNVTLGAVSLVSPGTIRGGVPVENVLSPPYDPRRAAP
jgi:beta-galactosidase GanA